MESPGVEQPRIVEGGTPHDCLKNVATPAVQAIEGHEGLKIRHPEQLRGLCPGRC
jgi:hypothetical protein